MKKLTYLYIAVFFANVAFAQGFQKGEFLKYRVHYGFLNAGFASLKVEEAKLKGEPYYHVIGQGSSSGAVRAFFKVDDRYETYIDKETYRPSKFIRKIREGGHRKHRILTFDNNRNVVTIKDLKHKTVKKVAYQRAVQDMLSAFYYLRTKPLSEFKAGTIKEVNVFMDGEEYLFKLKILEKEKIKTKFGWVKAIKMKPYVQKGRVFKEEESVSIWVTDDDNLIPLKIEAELAVGSVEMDLHAYRNLKKNIAFTKKK